MSNVARRAGGGRLGEPRSVALRGDNGAFGAAIVVEQTAPASVTDNLVRNWPAPDFGIEKHRIYMMQWYLFGGDRRGL
jgi:hypothetical protein